MRYPGAPRSGQVQRALAPAPLQCEPDPPSEDGEEADRDQHREGDQGDAGGDLEHAEGVVAGLVQAEAAAA